MELASLKEVIKPDGLWFRPSYPDGKACDFEFLIIGRNSEEYRRVTHKNMLKYASNRKKAAEEAIESADMFVAVVKDWRGLTVDGIPYPCTRENKEAMYKDVSLKWLTEQIESAVLDDSLFLSVKE